MSIQQQEFKFGRGHISGDEGSKGKRVGVYHVELVRDRSIDLDGITVIDTMASVRRIVAQEFERSDREKLICLWVNARNGLIGLEVVSVGTLTASLAHPREIFKGAILRNAAGIFIAHNHPSGDPRPSGEDIRLTRRLVEAGRLLGIELLDHVIIAENGAYSFKSEGAL